MLCSFCQIEMIATIENFSQRINPHLIRIGFWECPECGISKGMFEKNVEKSEEIMVSMKCHCCKDSGQIDPYLIRNFIFPEYSISDPPVMCKRCPAGRSVNYAWDLATREECDRIHKIQISKSFSESESIDIEKELAKLSNKLSIRSNS